MLKQRSISGRYFKNGFIIPSVASRCHSFPPSIFVTFPPLINIPIKLLPKPKASLALPLIVAGLRPQNGVSEVWIESN